MGISEEEVLEPIPSNFVERAIYVAKVKAAQQRGEYTQNRETQETNVNPVKQDTTTAETEITTHNVQKSPKKKFFRDANGNEYKIEGGALYLKTWKRLDVKARLVRIPSMKEVSLDGKEIQVYGWVRVDTSMECDDSSVNLDEMED